MDHANHHANADARTSRRRASSAMLLIALAAAMPLAAQAEPVVSLVGRDSLNYVEYKGESDPTGFDGTVAGGTPVPVTSFANPTLSINGGHSGAGSTGVSIEWSYSVGWNQAQGFSLIGSPSALNQISAWGEMSLQAAAQGCYVFTGLCGPAVVHVTGTNTQVLEFTVSEATAYSFAGQVYGGQLAYLDHWDTAQNKWFPVRQVIVDKSFAFSGTLNAGLYRVRANPYNFTADLAPPSLVNGWSYTVAFPNVTAVPEPEAWAMMVAGLISVFGVARRKRARGGAAAGAGR